MKKRQNKDEIKHINKRRRIKSQRQEKKEIKVSHLQIKELKSGKKRSLHT